MGRSPLVRGDDPLQIGGYWLAGRLGVGGQAVVYEAYDQAGRRFAVKVLRGAGFGQGAYREVEAARRVPPFCTARLLVAELASERPYIVNEFVDGPSLQAAVAEHGPLTGDALHRLAVGIITALAAIHRAGVVHRDLKPGNVLLGPDGPRVIDFGIARILADSATASHVLMGTLSYMAPEQFDGRRADKAADVHAWAATVVFAATGRHAFGGEYDEETVCAVQETMPDLGDLPAALCPLVAAALAKNPSDRPTAVELLDQLIGDGAAEEPDLAASVSRHVETGRHTTVTGIRPVSTTGGGTTDDGHRALRPRRVDELLRAGRDTAAHRLAPGCPYPSPALGEVAEELYVALTEDQRRVLAQVLLRMLEPEPDGGLALHGVSVHELPSDAGSPGLDVVASRLVDAALVRRDGGRLSLANAALARSWPRLRGWIAEEGEGLRVLGRLHAAASFWHEHGSREGDLLQGSLLEQTTSWAATSRTRVALSRLERSYLDASRRLLRRRDRRRQTVSAVLAAMVVVLLLAAVGLVTLNRIATAERQRADDQRNVAISRQLAAESQDLALLDPVLSRLLAVAAWQMGPTAEAKASLFDALFNPALVLLDGHTGGVGSVVFSPDGTRLATGGGDDTARVWDAGSGRQLFELTGHDGGVRSVVFSPDGTRLATTSDDGPARVWDAGSGQELFELTGHDGGVRSVVFSPDGTRLATGGGDDTAWVWDAGSGRQLFELTGHSEGAMPVVYSPDGTRLATTSDYGTARVWDADTGQHRATVIGEPAGFSPDSTRLVTRRLDTVKVWDAGTGEPVGEMATHTNDTGEEVGGEVALSPDGTRVAAALGSGVEVWDVDTGELVVELTGHTAPVRSAVFSPNGTRLATTGDDGVPRVWDASTGELVVELTGHTAPVRSVVFSPDGTRLATAGEGGARIWDADAGEPVVELTGHTGEVMWVAFGPDSTRVATGSTSVETRIWDTDTGDPVVVLGGRSGVFSPDGSRMVTFSDSHTAAWVWDATTGDLVAELAPNADQRIPLNPRVVFGPDGTRVATVDRNDTARIWDVDTGDLIVELAGDRGAVSLVELSPDGTRVATFGWDDTARIWDVDTGDPIAELAGHGGAVRSVVFTPDGTRVATFGQDGTVRIWDTANGALVGELVGDTDEVWSLVFSPDGTRLATIRVGGVDSGMSLWDAETGNLVAETVERWSILNSAVPSMAFSPDSTLLAIPHTNGATSLWDTETGIQVAELVGHTGAVWSTVFSPDGTRLATAGADRTARVWDLAAVLDPYSALCASLGRPLSKEEWRTHIPGIPYQRTC